jgi:uncharacterized protein YecE (DUF72 family)
MNRTQIRWTTTSRAFLNRLSGASIAVEFRHPSWVRSDVQRAETMRFLRSHGLYYTSIDAPEDKSIVPSFIEATGDQV